MEWKNILNDVDWKTPFVMSENRRNAAKVYPQSYEVFRALWLSPFEKTKVVILGQDPYYTYGYANGLAFAVNPNTMIPQSLNNIFQELESDIGQYQTTKELLSWTRQGVLLLNRTLTVEDGSPNSHQRFGWSDVTNHIIKCLSDNRNNLVFILWGKNAQVTEDYIDETKHLIIKSSHPSPLSAHKGFFGSKPFSTTNSYLKRKNIKEIIW